MNKRKSHWAKGGQHKKDNPRRKARREIKKAMKFYEAMFKKYDI